MARRWGYVSRPSGGLKAFFTFVLLCDTLSLFGFGGSGTIDGHKLSGHAFDEEHSFLAKVARGALPGSALPKDKIGPHGALREAFARFGARLQCLSGRGRIAFL